MIKTVITWLRCEECGSLFPISRHAGRQRKVGHIKDLWCVKCKKTTKHIEIKDGIWRD